MRKTIIIAAICLAAALGTAAQTPQQGQTAVATGRFWSNWYVQAGLDMTLQNPYGKNFAHVFPNGKSFGLNVAAGKWFSHELGMRVRVNWENGFKPFENGHITWIAKGDHESNMDGGGYFAVYLDVPLNLHSIFAGYKPDRKWNIYAFPRAGLVSNRATSSGSPMVGVGWGCTYRLNQRWSLYADMAYQMTTSEFYAGVSNTGMSVATGSNGFFDFHIGVQLDLGKGNANNFPTVDN